MKYKRGDILDLMKYVEENGLIKFYDFYSTILDLLLKGDFRKGIDTSKRKSKEVQTFERLFPEVLRVLKMPEEDLILDIDTIEEDSSGIVRKWRLVRSP